MQNQNSKQVEHILSELQASGLSLALTSKNTLRVTGKATQVQLAACRQYKAQIIEKLSPHCSNCDLQMQLIDGGNLWFCPLGCQSQERFLT